MDLFNTHFELSDSGIKLAILPIGAIEQHSHHLPLGTDSIIAWHMSRKVAAALEEAGYPNYLLPPQPFSTSLEHKGFSGTITLTPPTLALVVKDIVKCLYDHGFERVILLNHHGGNFILKPTVREINYDNPGKKVIFLEGWGALSQEENEQIFETDGIHSGEAETSVMLALNEELVGDKRVDFIPDYPRPALDMYSFKTMSPDGVWGIPSKATKAKGEKQIAKAVKNKVKYLVQWLEDCEKNSEY